MIEHLTTQAVAQMLSGEVVGRTDILLDNLAPLEHAVPGCLTFIRSAEYAGRWRSCQASAALVTRGVDVPGHDAAARALIYVADADRALVALLEHFAALAAPPPPCRGVHPAALVEAGAEVHDSASIGPHCVVGHGAKVGAGCILHARVVVGRACRIGDRTTLHPGVVLYPRTVIGARCTLHANVSIGADGFGYLPHPSGKGHVKIPHLGNVVIGDDVEIGAGACVDRAKFGSTTVGDGAKIDNLVQVGHGVNVGRYVLLCGQVGIGGSSNIGESAVLAGQAGVADNINIGAGARIGAQAGAIRDIPPGWTVWGTPARPIIDTLRSYAAMGTLTHDLRVIRSRLDALERAATSDQPANEHT
ncbi:MAG TPA: UDP-3-O-(3-hydroxymyristoyl)glucosamine N-acyltransferase [Phycisphaerales bacterium]|nr:UDP-3-O-(3-hydroxymyristoyl)glucosamine N-acyltransferase [Phycisphaerales bacterium]